MKVKYLKMSKLFVMVLIGLLSAHCVMADIAPWPARRRNRVIPITDDPVKQKQEQKKGGELLPPVVEVKEPLTATMYGILIDLRDNATEAATHALCRKLDDKWVAVCYIKTKLELGRYEKREVKVTGVPRQIQGWTCPVLLVENESSIELNTPPPKPQQLPPPIQPPKKEQPPKPEEEK